ncbi:MAG TPA: hypothetical protein VH583_24270 [Vicinamibacterales bacterium]|jgi:hypothetical protein
MKPPNSTYLKALIAVIDGNAAIPVDIRNECHRLMQAIDANNADSITTSVERIEQLARDASVALPGRDR